MKRIIICIAVLLFASLSLPVHAEEAEGWICVDDGERQACRAQCDQQFYSCNHRCWNSGWLFGSLRTDCLDRCETEQDWCYDGCASDFTCIPIY